MLGLEETRTIAVRADTLAASAVRSNEQIARNIEEMRRENTSQHLDGRKQMSDGLRRVHQRIDEIRNLIDRRDEKFVDALRAELTAAVSTVRQEALAAAKPGESASKSVASLERWISRGLILFLAAAIVWILKNLTPIGR